MGCGVPHSLEDWLPAKKKKKKKQEHNLAPLLIDLEMYQRIVVIPLNFTLIRILEVNIMRKESRPHMLEE